MDIVTLNEMKRTGEGNEMRVVHILIQRSGQRKTSKGWNSNSK